MTVSMGTVDETNDVFASIHKRKIIYSRICSDVPFKLGVTRKIYV